jgi:hypothetical protein
MNPANFADLPVEPVVGALRIAGGVRLEDAAPCAATLAPPPRVGRGREGERLFLLSDLTGPASPHLYRELREVVAKTYWSATGSVTAALRQAAAAANRYLFHTNLHAAPSDRCDGSLICAASHGDDVFILQAGSGRACFLRGERLECFSRGEEPAPLGRGRLADVCLYHVFVTPGDTLLLASPTLIREAGVGAVARVLPRAGVQEVMDGLEQIGAGADLVALVVRWALPGEAPGSPDVPQPVPRPRRELPQRKPRSEAAAIREPPRPTLRSRAAVSPDSGEFGRAVEPRELPRPKPRARPKPARPPGPSLGERMQEGVRLVGGGIAAAGVGLAGGARTLFRRMLPGPEREARLRARSRRPRASRSAPKENRTVMMAVAIGIPVVLAIVVAWAYFSFGAEVRFRDLINRAEEEAALAQATGGFSEGARPHWEAALEHATAASALRPDAPVATALRSQAQAVLDFLDGIVRLQPVHLWDFGPGTVPRQLAIHGQMVFVLDRAEGWIAQLTLNPAGDGVVEQGDSPIVVQTGQQIGGEEVGSLVDFAWVSAGGERQTSGLLTLEEGGALVGYDPAWMDEGGVPRLTRSLLGTPPTGTSRAVGSFGGRFYILDVVADQIWRYEPRGYVYPEQPDRYFVVPPDRPLADVLDMVIDGHVYLLYQDGIVIKYLRGEPQPFDVRGLPGDISQAVALALDPDGGSGVVYVADRGDDQRAGRVVVLGPDGVFQEQYCADEAFDVLEALAVDEAARRLYVISGGRLYVASLP